MSTLMEDRLTAALHARADQVQPEDLRPLDVPAVRRMPPRPFWGVLAVAAATAAILVPLAFDGGESARPAPAPSTDGPSAEATPFAEQASFRGDVDGDGTDDLVRLDQSNLLRVDLAAGGRIESQLDSGAELMGLADLGVSGLAVVLDAGGGVGDAAVLRVENGDLFPVETGDREWIGRAEGQTFWVADRTLYNGMYDPQHLDREVVPVTVSSWTMPDNFLSSEQVGRWCWEHRTGDEPRPCRPGEEVGTDGGQHGGLPELLPAVEERLAGEPYPYGIEFTGAGSKDYAQLQGDLGQEAGAVAEGQVDLVVTVNGEEHRAPLPAGQSPWLVPQFLAVHGDAPVLVVEQSGGDSSQLTVFGFGDDGELRRIQPVGDVFLGSGFVDRDGEMTEQRTWVTPGGQLFTAILLDHETRRHQLFRWNDSLGETIAPTDLGEACIDWVTGDYGRCP